MTQNVSENLSYQLNDFISLRRVSEKIAKQIDDTPDLFLTLERCIDVGISLLIWLSRDVVVSRVGKLEDWHGALFLTGECVDELLNSRGDSIKVRRFLARSRGDMLRGLRRSDELWIDSWYEGDDWPCVEFDIEAVRILRTDLVKLNLVPDVVAELKPEPVVEVLNDSKLQATQEESKPEKRRRLLAEKIKDTFSDPLNIPRGDIANKLCSWYVGEFHLSESSFKTDLGILRQNGVYSSQSKTRG